MEEQWKNTKEKTEYNIIVEKNKKRKRVRT